MQPCECSGARSMLRAISLIRYYLLAHGSDTTIRKFFSCLPCQTIDWSSVFVVWLFLRAHLHANIMHLFFMFCNCGAYFMIGQMLDESAFRFEHGGRCGAQASAVKYVDQSGWVRARARARKLCYSPAVAAGAGGENMAAPRSICISLARARVCVRAFSLAQLPPMTPVRPVRPSPFGR